MLSTKRRHLADSHVDNLNFVHGGLASGISIIYGRGLVMPTQRLHQPLCIRTCLRQEIASLKQQIYSAEQQRDRAREQALNLNQQLEDCELG